MFNCTVQMHMMTMMIGISVDAVVTVATSNICFDIIKLLCTCRIVYIIHTVCRLDYDQSVSS